MNGRRDDSPILKLNDDVWLLKSTKTMPLMKIPVMTAAVRTSRGVVIIGPGRTISDHVRELEDLGRVTDLIAPNLLHHLSIHKAHETFSQATVWGASGLKKKRPDVAWDKTLGESAWSYGDEIKLIEIKGVPDVNECVFYHMKSKTLIVTDLFFNIVNARGIGAWLILKLFGTYRRFGISKFYLKFAKDPMAFRHSLSEIRKLDFQNIVVSHGEPVTANARELFDRAVKERGLVV